MKWVALPCGCRFGASEARRRYASDRCARHRHVDMEGSGEPISVSLYRVVEHFGTEAGPEAEAGAKLRAGGGGGAAL